MFKKIAKFLSIKLNQCSRIATISTYNFFENDCYTKAAVLTFYTLQFIVPFLALLLGIAKGFGFDGYLENLITQTFYQQKEVLLNVIQIAISMLQHIGEGVIVGMGVILLFWANINLFSYIESTLNHIWKIKIQRTFLRKFTDYLAIILICPLILIASSSLTVYIKTEISHLHEYPLFKTVSFITDLIFTTLPFILSWILFFLIYVLLPNAKFRVWPRVLAAIFAGTIFQLWQIIFINFQIQLFNYGAIYGAFSIFPLLLIWLQFSWTIALFGAEIASAIENVLFYKVDEFGKNSVKASKVHIGFLILYHCLKTFYTYRLPLTDLQIAQNLSISLETTRKMLDTFVNGKILAPVEVKTGETSYLPLFDPYHFTIMNIRDIITESNRLEILVQDSEILRKISEILKNLDTVAENSSANIRITNLL